MDASRWEKRSQKSGEENVSGDGVYSFRVCSRAWDSWKAARKVRFEDGFGDSSGCALMEQEQSDRQESYSNGESPITGVIHLRLDTSNMLDQIEAFLRGTRLMGYRQESSGEMKPLYLSNGRPKLNDEGVQSIMSWLTLQLSPHTVQGNFSDDRFDEYICEFEIDLRQMLMTNLYHWNVRIEDYNTVTDGIMLTVQPFFSRLIDNKERESYNQTVRSQETHTVNAGQKSGGLMGFFKG
jgi:hypothetical protein